jgi:hypothetical protein
VQQQIAALNQQIGELCTHFQTLTANQPHACPLKINSPKEFSDKCLEARSFLAQCKLAFRANPNYFPSNDAKVVYGASYLCKDVFLWYQTHLARLTAPFTWETFKTSFLEAWGETDEEQTAKDKLKCIQQKGASSMYVTEFNHYALLSRFDELALHKLFYYNGLKDGVKDLLLTLPSITSLYDYQKQAIKCDLCLFKCSKEQKLGQASARQPPTTTMAMPSSSPTDNPLEIEMTCMNNIPKSMASGKKGPLTDAEKLRHRENHLCLYCGDSDCSGAKQVDDCPRMQLRTQEKSPTELKCSHELCNEAPRQSPDSGNIAR